MSVFKRSIYITLAVAILLCGCAKDKETFKEEPSKPTVETISLVAVGDNLLHMPVINSGKQTDGSLNYEHLYSKLQPAFRDADIAVIGQETVLGGKELGYSGYPLFNSPTEVGDSIVEAGFDIVLHASNHTNDKLVAGVERTLEFWKKHPQVTVLGINNSPEEKEAVDVITVKGARLAVLNYTYGTNGISLPSDKAYMVNYIDEEKIQKDTRWAEVNTDFTIAFMHWGTEYSSKPDSFQKDLAQKMCDWGVDLIIGSHPHVIEPVEWYYSEGGNSMLVYYSLGNYVSRQLEARNLLGGMADVELRYNGERVYIHDYKFVPIVTHYNMQFGGFGVYRLDEYTNEMAAGHGVQTRDGAVSVERWRKMVDSTFEGYDTMCLDY